MATYDLHLHTNWSYDAFSDVEDYFKLARKKSTRAIAITDHHLMDGYDQVLECAAKYPDVGYISGSEISVSCEFGAIDLVCLNLPRRLTPELETLFEMYHNWQIDYGSAISANFCRLGYAFDDSARMELLKSYRTEAAIARQGNSHVRNGTMVDYFIKAGFCKDIEGYREIRRQFEPTPPYPSYDKVIPLVKAAGGIVIIAHPFGYFLQNDRKRMDTLREMLQLDGIECAHPGVPEEMTPVYRAYCEEYGLLSSGGSDLHEPVEAEFAGHCGPERWLDEILERVTIYHGA